MEQLLLNISTNNIITTFPDEEIDIKAFTYPGPKPFSKEMAILMMADSAEASARSIKKSNSREYR